MVKNKILGLLILCSLLFHAGCGDDKKPSQPAAGPTEPEPQNQLAEFSPWSPIYSPLLMMPIGVGDMIDISPATLGVTVPRTRSATREDSTPQATRIVVPTPPSSDPESGDSSASRPQNDSHTPAPLSHPEAEEIPRTDVLGMTGNNTPDMTEHEAPGMTSQPDIPSHPERSEGSHEDSSPEQSSGTSAQNDNVEAPSHDTVRVEQLTPRPEEHWIPLPQFVEDITPPRATAPDTTDEVDQIMSDMASWSEEEMSFVTSYNRLTTSNEESPREIIGFKRYLSELNPSQISFLITYLKLFDIDFPSFVTQVTSRFHIPATEETLILYGLISRAQQIEVAPTPESLKRLSEFILALWGEPDSQTLLNEVLAFKPRIPFNLETLKQEVGTLLQNISQIDPRPFVFAENEYIQTAIQHFEAATSHAEAQTNQDLIVVRLEELFTTLIRWGGLENEEAILGSLPGIHVAFEQSNEFLERITYEQKGIWLATIFAYQQVLRETGWQRFSIRNMALRQQNHTQHRPQRPWVYETNDVTHYPFYQRVEATHASDQATTAYLLSQETTDVSELRSYLEELIGEREREILLRNFSGFEDQLIEAQEEKEQERIFFETLRDGFLNLASLGGATEIDAADAEAQTQGLNSTNPLESEFWQRRWMTLRAGITGLGRTLSLGFLDGYVDARVEGRSQTEALTEGAREIIYNDIIRAREEFRRGDIIAGLIEVDSALLKALGLFGIGEAALRDIHTPRPTIPADIAPNNRTAAPATQEPPQAAPRNRMGTGSNGVSNSHLLETDFLPRETPAPRETTLPSESALRNTQAYETRPENRNATRHQREPSRGQLTWQDKQRQLRAAINGVRSGFGQLFNQILTGIKNQLYPVTEPRSQSGPIPNLRQRMAETADLVAENIQRRTGNGTQTAAAEALVNRLDGDVASRARKFVTAQIYETVRATLQRLRSEIVGTTNATEANAFTLTEVEDRLRIQLSEQNINNLINDAIEAKLQEMTRHMDQSVNRTIREEFPEDLPHSYRESPVPPQESSATQDSTATPRDHVVNAQATAEIPREPLPQRRSDDAAIAPTSDFVLDPSSPYIDTRTGHSVMVDAAPNGRVIVQCNDPHYIPLSLSPEEFAARFRVIETFEPGRLPGTMRTTLSEVRHGDVVFEQMPNGRFRRIGEVTGENQIHLTDGTDVSFRFSENGEGEIRLSHTALTQDNLGISEQVYIFDTDRVQGDTAHTNVSVSERPALRSGEDALALDFEQSTSIPRLRLENQGPIGAQRTQVSEVQVGDGVYREISGEWCRIGTVTERVGDRIVWSGESQLDVSQMPISAIAELSSNGYVVLKAHDLRAGRVVLLFPEGERIAIFSRVEGGNNK